MKKANRVGVIGAGPAGLIAAIMAGRGGAEVGLFEANARPGKKLAVTGSGRCNITNQHLDPMRYVCRDSRFVLSVLEAFAHRDLVRFLESIAVPIKVMEDGWCYPLSESAANVVAALTAALQIEGVVLHLQEEVRDFYPVAEGWQVVGAETYTFDRLIVASGGKAYPQLGSRGSGYPVLGRLGHTIMPSRPALAPIVAEMSRLHKLQGVRMDVALTLLRGAECLGASHGNAIFTQWGVNGPAAMDLSHLIAMEQDNLELEIDFLARYKEMFFELFAQRVDSDWPVRVVLGSVLLPKVVQVLMHWSGVADDLSMRHLGEQRREALFRHLQHTRVAVTGTRDFNYAQVSAGGVPVHEVEARTCLSLKQRGLYLAGEVLDVVGPCGGYNLQFAFSTGALAGKAAAAF